MADDNDEKITREKKAIESLRGATASMKIALERISALESALRRAADTIEFSKHYVGDRSYVYRTDSSQQTTVHDYLSREAAEARKIL